MATTQTKNLKALITLNDQLSKPLKQVKASMKSFQKSASQFSASFASLSTLTFAPMMAGIGALGGIVKSSVKSFAEYSSSVKDTAIKTNTATDALQRLRYAAEQSGSSAEQLDGAMQIFSKNLANGLAGRNKQLIDTFKGLGIELKNANGEYKTTAELMPEIADAMKRQTNAQQKAYIATTMFGRGGQSLIQMLEQGSDALDALGKDAEKFGVVVDHDAIIAAADFNDALGRLETAGQGLKNTLGSQLIPILRLLVDGMSDWVATNREWIATTIGDAVRDFVDHLKKIDFKAIITQTIEFIKNCVALFNALGGLKTIGVIISTLFASKLVVAFMSTVTALVGVGKAIGVVSLAIKALGVAFAMNPIGAIITAIVAVIAGAVYLIYKYWEPIKGFFEKLWEGIKSVFSWYVDLIKKEWDVICNLPEYIKAAWNVLANWFSTLWEGIKAAFFAPFEKAVDTVMKSIGAIKKAGSWVGDKFDSATSAVSSAWDSTKSFLGFGDDKPLQPVDVSGGNMKGDLTIHVETDGNSSASVEQNKADNMNLNTVLPSGGVR
ncbi:MAG: hypothetical protein ACI4NC_06310 [Succinivibrio sp.]